MKFSAYIFLFLALLAGPVVRAQITYPLGHQGALDILFNMPESSLANTSIGWALAERAGSGVMNNYGYLGTNVPATVRGTNLSGKLDLSVTINANFSYTGTITGQAGIPVAQISGSIAGQVGASVTGTFNLFFQWETLTDMDGNIYIEYKIGVGAEVRTGHLETGLRIEEIVYTGPGQPPVVSPAEAAAAPGGRLIYKSNYKYYNQPPTWLYVFVGGGGSVILWPIEYPGW